MIKNPFKLMLGILAMTFGIAIYGWVFYNMFFPTKEFKESAGLNTGQYIFPGLMITFGAKWILDSIYKSKN